MLDKSRVIILIWVGVYEAFEEKYPKLHKLRSFEQNMIGLASGLALTGKKFLLFNRELSTLRCLEQIRNDVCYHDLDVTIVSVGEVWVWAVGNVSSRD